MQQHNTQSKEEKKKEEIRDFAKKGLFKSKFKRERYLRCLLQLNNQ